MRVLQVMAGAAHGGAETFFVDLVTALARAGLEQKVVIRVNPERAASLRVAGVEHVELPMGGALDLRTKGRLARVISDFRPDIVQSWMRRATGFVSRPKNWGDFTHVGWFGGYYEVRHFSACDHLIAVTEDIRRHQIASGWPGDRAHYLPTFARETLAEPAARGEMETPDDAPLFLALGRLHEKKAFDILIQAMAQLPEAHLWVAGEGPLKAKLEALIRELDLAARVRLLGWREDREALLAAADVCVLPSRYEPFGTVMIEAWAQETPLIAAAASGPEALIDHEATGLLVPVDDVTALAQAMRRLIEDPGLAARLAAAGRAAFDSRFTEAAVVGQYLDFYHRLVNR
ncbi:MAG TPA: glycosyltransferase [Alphaproteobacteria bacterium]|nr:glycosyltransferase [Alphaproteobacteria bacterium]